MKVIKPATTALFPVPAVMVTCGRERPNIITLAWVGTVCSDPPAVGIGVRPERFSHGLLMEHGEFVVNLPSVDQVAALDYCGHASGRDVDKRAACRLTPAPASKVDVPLIAECPIALECRVRQRIPLGAHDLFLGEVLAVQASEEVLDKQGRLDYGRARLLVYTGLYYYGLGELLGRNGQWQAGIG